MLDFFVDSDLQRLGDITSRCSRLRAISEINNMKIKEFGKDYWNMFLVPFPAKEGETEHAYLLRAEKLIKAFYRKYTNQDRDSQNNSGPFRTDMGQPRNYKLESLTEEWNFCYFHLKGIPWCDVKFNINTPGEFHDPDRLGVHVHSHRDRPEERKPQVDFLRQKWKEFNYPQRR